MQASSSSDPPVRIWVGKIPSGLDEDFIERLLGACGPLKEWRRVVDPVTNSQKAFGFCTWQSPRGALCALRTLHGMDLEGGQLELKPGKASETLIEDWLARGNVFADPEVSAAQLRIEHVLEERAAMPQRTKDVLKMEATRSENRQRKVVPSRESEANRDAARVEEVLKRKREDRRRERERYLQDQQQLEQRGLQLEQQWLERELGVQRARQRRAQECEDDRVRRTTALGDMEPAGLAARRERVWATERARRKEERSDAELRRSRVMFSGNAPLLHLDPSHPAEEQPQGHYQQRIPFEPLPGSTKSLKSSGNSRPHTSIFALQEAEDDADEAKRRAMPSHANSIFVPDGKDTLYRRKLTAADVEAIVQSIPTKAADLYIHPIDWAFLVSIGALVDTGKVREFVSKSITELVGEMKDMVDFIMSLLRRGVAASELETKMGLVLQEDAPVFVVKLWRFLVFLVKSEKMQRE